MKKKLLALAIGSVLSAAAQAGINDIVITEAVDNKAEYKNRAIEITNTGSSDYTFTNNIEIAKQSNGGKWYTLSGTSGLTIPAGKTAVLHNPSATAELIATVTANGGAAIASNTSLTGTGNDAYAIRNIADPAKPIVLDAVGVIDSSDDWGKDSTLRRKLDSGAQPKQNKGVFEILKWDVIADGSFEHLGTKPGDSVTPPTPPTPSDCTTAEQTTIAEVQGSGSSSPLITSGFESAEEYNVQGIVSAVTTLPKKGFFLAEITPDGNPATSDGIFVSTSATPPAVGNTVCVKSKVKENYGHTELFASTWDVVDAGTSGPAAVNMTVIPEDNGLFENTLERHEGMLINLPRDMDTNEDGEQNMRVSRTYGFNYNSYRNNINLSYKRPNIHPNQNFVAGSPEAKAMVAQNNDYRLILESNKKAEDGKLPYFPTFHTDAANNYIRIDDTMFDMEGVITYGYGDYSMTVTNTITNSNFVRNTPRTDSPNIDTTTKPVNFAIKIATQNVLNLFNSPFGGDDNLHGESRGADTEEEYQRQKEKLVAAIYGLDADIVGLMELENNGFAVDGTISEFVDAINAEYYITRPELSDSPHSEVNKYAFLGFDSNGDAVLDDLDSVGSDVITSGIIYRPETVSVIKSQIIQMPSQHAPTIVNNNNVVVKDKYGEVLESGDNYQRNTVTATFAVNQTGKQLTVAVNHLKSKGSTCYEDWNGVDFGTEEEYSKKAPDTDLQGNCENFRVAAAVQIGDELKKIGGDQVVLGDMNSNGQEDPMLVLTSNPTGKVLTTARDTFIGKTPQFNTSGDPINVTQSYGFISAVDKKDKEHGKTSWSYSYNDEISSLDHVLITKSLDSRLIDAKDWHINAGESTYYDYNIVRMDSKRGLVPAKGKSGHDDFYASNAFRSSDHDSAIISLSYKYGETKGNTPVLVNISSSTMEIPYVIPVLAQADDLAKISLKATNDDADLSKAIIPHYAMTAKQALAKFEIAGITAGTYTATMTLERNGVTVKGSETSLNIKAIKKDSLTPKIIVPEADNSGGSFGIFSLLSLIGLGFLRKKLN